MSATATQGLTPPSIGLWRPKVKRHDFKHRWTGDEARTMYSLHHGWGETFAEFLDRVKARIID